MISEKKVDLKKKEHVIAKESSTFERPTHGPKDIFDMYEGCHVKKGCFGGPHEDCLKQYNCDYMVTYNVTPAKEGRERAVHISLMWNRVKPDEYIAVGFSHDDKMGDDAVKQCILSNNTVHVGSSYNAKEGKHNKVIHGDAKEGGIINHSSKHWNSFIDCQMEIAETFNHEGTSFDFIKNNYYLFLATGRVEDKATGQIAKHFEIPLTTAHAVNLSSHVTVPHHKRGHEGQHEGHEGQHEGHEGQHEGQHGGSSTTTPGNTHSPTSEHGEHGDHGEHGGHSEHAGSSTSAPGKEHAGSSAIAPVLIVTLILPVLLAVVL
jgi:hypothetical protein